MTQDFKYKKLPFIIATVGEFIALFFWLFFMDRGQWILSNLLLCIGFVIERLTVLWWAEKNFGDRIKLPIPKKPVWIFFSWLIAITVSEIVIWIAFRAAFDCRTLAEYGNAVRISSALAILFLGEQLQHSYELHAMKGLSWASQFFSVNTAMITALETAGGAGLLLAIRNPEWFVFAGDNQIATSYVVGGVVLLLGLGVEHVVEGQALSPDAPT
jgi:hypothetical protein